MKAQITLTLENENFNTEKDFENCLNDVLIPYFDNGKVLEIKEIPLIDEEKECRADLFRKYDYDINGELQENFSN